MNARAHRGAVGGQAMTEFLVAAGVLVSLALGLPALWGFHRVQGELIQSARLQAFTAEWSGGVGREIDGVAGAAAEAILVPLQAAGSLLGGGFDLRARGYQEVWAERRVEGAAGLWSSFEGLELELREGQRQLGSAWGAAGSADVLEKSDGLSVAERLRQVGSVLTLLRPLVELVEPDFRHWCPGRNDVEAVPADRLGPQATESRAFYWRPPC